MLGKTTSDAEFGGVTEGLVVMCRNFNSFTNRSFSREGTGSQQAHRKTTEKSSSQVTGTPLPPAQDRFPAEKSP